MLGQFQHFVTGEFNGAGFMHAYVSGAGRNNALIGRQHGIDNDLVGLGSAY